MLKRNEYVLIARGGELDKRPVVEWQAAVRVATGKMRGRLAFMTGEHHAVRNFAVTAIPWFQRPLRGTEVAAHLCLAARRVQEVTEELERNLFFLVRNASGAIAWAFPVTADRTAHEMHFSTGERTFGA
jgi:hypothetical protein